MKIKIISFIQTPKNTPIYENESLPAIIHYIFPTFPNENNSLNDYSIIFCMTIAFYFTISYDCALFNDASETRHEL